MKRAALFLGVAAFLALGAVLSTRHAADSEGPFVADPADCIVGLDRPRHLTHPAQVDHPRALEATEPVREMRRRRVDPTSAEGIILREQGEAIVRESCHVVMVRFGYDSVWRRILRRDGQPVPDVTAEVLLLVRLPRTEVDVAAGGAMLEEHGSR